MSSVSHKRVSPSKSSVWQTFAQALGIQAASGVAQVHGVHQTKLTHELEHEQCKSTEAPTCFDGDGDTVAAEGFIARLFAGVSAVKAGYAQLQLAQSPYDADGIQSADLVVVSELKNLSELKRSYFDKQLGSNHQSFVEIQEQSSLLKTYEIMLKKLDTQLKLKSSEITFLCEKLEEVKSQNNLLQKRLDSIGKCKSVPAGNLSRHRHFSGLSHTNFITFLQQTIQSIRSFVGMVITEMKSAGWDIDAAANSIQPGVVYKRTTHMCYAFESFVCLQMFDGFGRPNFSISVPNQCEKKTMKRIFFHRFMELQSMEPRKYLSLKPKSTFAKFCRTKYLRLVHPKMESSLFGNLDMRRLVSSGEYPESSFIATFTEMAKWVWVLHCLAFSLEPEASIFQAKRGGRFSEVYMESVSQEVLFSSETHRQVAFTVIPGFKMGKTVIQCQVYPSLNPEHG